MKIEEQVLSREQMAHLVELGVDTSDASMYWSRENSCGERYWVLLPYDKDYGYDKETIPAYTIGDLIEKLPKDLSSFSLALQYEHNKIGYYETSYGNIDTHHEEDLSNNPILGLYNMLCWMAEFHKELI